VYIKVRSKSRNNYEVVMITVAIREHRRIGTQTKLILLWTSFPVPPGISPSKLTLGYFDCFPHLLKDL